MTLPDFLRQYFWDTDFATLQFPLHESYCIERILEYGDDEAIGWLCRTFSRQRLAQVVRQSRALSPKTANFWGLILSIPRDQMRCFSTPSLLQHGSFSARSGS